MSDQKTLAKRFRALHATDGAFVIPNPWDAGSAHILQELGFAALATTSAGFAESLGRHDGEVSRDEKAEHCRQICTVVDVPVSADLENGFGDSPEDVAATIRAASAAGVVGGSIEDWSGSTIYDFNHAVERIQAAVEAARGLEVDFVLTARAENLLRNHHHDMDDTIARLQAFSAAGADVLYAPGLKTLDEVRMLTSAVDKPVNVLSPLMPGVSVAQLAAAGAKRISIGSALARLMQVTVRRAGMEMLGAGEFSWLGELR